MRKRMASGLLAAVMVMAMMGCGSADSVSGEEESAGASQAAAGEEQTEDDEAETTELVIPAGEESELLLEFRENGLRVGYANDVPYEYIDDDGNFTGFEIEIIAAVCERLGITELVPVLTSWDTYATELQQDKYDIFGCGVYVTDERLEVMNMCNKTYNLKECILVREDSGIETVEDLADKSVASSVGMLYMDVTQEAADNGIFGSAVEGGQPSALALDVQTGKVDAAMIDIVMGGYLSTQANIDGLKVLENWENMTEGYCSYLFNIASTEFVKEFNLGLDAIKEDGTMEAILDAYGMDGAMVGVEEGQVELPR